MSGPKRSNIPSRRAAERRTPRRLPPANRGGDAGDGWRSDRAQTTLDFAIGISVFLAVILFVFAFVPGILQPFNLSGEADTALAERIASDISQGKLGDASTPYVLESSCAVQFFDETDGPPSHCNYGGDDLHERLGVGNTYNLNVTLEGAFSGTNSELACWDSDTQKLYEAGTGSCSGGNSVTLAAGGIPPQANDATVTARRVVSLHQQNLTLKVVVW